MNLAHVEKELKQAVQQPYEVPYIVRCRIDGTLASLPNRRPLQWKRVSSAFGASAAALCVIALGSGFVMPQAAAALRQLPGVSSVFKFAGDYGLRAADEKGLVTTVKQSVTDKGITVDITEVMYDGSRISIGYIQQSPGAIEEITRGIDFSIDGKRYTSSLSGTGSPMDEHTYAGVIDLHPAEELPARFELKMDIRQIGNTPGKWSFSIPVKKMASSNKAVVPMVTRTYGDITLTVKKLLFTPGSTQLDVEVKQPAADDRFIQYHLFDDSGNELQRRSGGGGGQTDGKVSVSTFSQQYGPVHRIPQAVTIKPYVDVPVQGALKEQKAVLDRKPTPEQPIVLTQGEAGRLIITEVERLPDKTLVHYRTEGLIPNEQSNLLWIEDKSGKQHLLLQKSTTTVDPVHYSFIREFPAFADNETLTFVTRELSPPAYLKELEITIPIEP